MLATTSRDGQQGSTRTVVRHYTDGSDNPGWVEETTPGSPSPVVTRYVESLAGELGAIAGSASPAEITLTNLHGDVVTSTAIADESSTAVGINAWQDFDEYGNPHNASGPDEPMRYGWLGAKQRSADTGTSGLIMMGARLYNPVTGRFTSGDRVPGGNENAYNYPNDPINQFDADGLLGWPKIKVKMPSVKWGQWIDRVNTGLQVATVFGCGVCAGVSAAISVGRGIYKVRSGDRSGWLDIAGAGLHGAARGLKYAGKLRRARTIAKHPKGIRGKAGYHKQQRKKAAKRHRRWERTVVRRADRIDRAYGAYGLAQDGYRMRRGTW